MKKLLLIAATVLLLGGCWDDSEETATADHYAGAVAGGGKMMNVRGEVAPMAAPAPSRDMAQYAPSEMVMDRSQISDRKIAETHSLSIETAYDALQPRFQRDYKKCIELGCEIINSSITAEQGANINARIDPAKLSAFLDFLAEGPGTIENHSVSADDYTVEYSDIEAATKNRIALRDRLTMLLNSRAADVDDILRIEEELTRVQTEIDQNAQRLRILQKMTAMATLNLNYTVQYRPADVKPYELKNTFKHATQRFLMAVDRMIQFVGATLPWIPVFFLGVWLGVRVVRFALVKLSLRWPWRKG